LKCSIRCESLNGKGNSFFRQRRERFLWNRDFATNPGMARISANQKAKRSLLSRFITETDDDHKHKLEVFERFANT
jgi:hypothetical protein